MSGGGTRLPVVGPSRAAGPVPAFERIAVVGLGAVGGSLALALRQAWPEALVIGVDTHDVIETAVRLHAVDVGADDLGIAGDAELVVLAGSAAENARVLPFLADAIAGHAIVLALGGAGAADEVARALPARLPVVVGMASIEPPWGGIAAARSDLFQGRRWSLRPLTAGPDAVGRVRRLVSAIGGDAPDTERPA